MNDPLPDTLSELILVAVKDARKLDRDKYCPYHLSWHEMFGEELTCSICDAGAVMAGTLQVERDVTKEPDDFNESVNSKLCALDQARHGYYYAALDSLGIDCEVHLEEIEDLKPSPFYSYTNWEEFDKHLNHIEGIAQQLKELGY